MDLIIYSFTHLKYMLDWLDHIDKEIFLYINSFHSPLSDQIWIWITNIPSWIPLYLLLLFIVIKVFKKDSVYIIIGLILVILASDQFTSSFMKPFFGRLRPCHDPEIGYLVHIAKKCGGQFGFASGHAANSFGIAMFIWMVFRSYWKWTWLIFLWALTVAISRIMIGVHYPGDILTGGLIGASFGGLIFKLTGELYFRIKLEPLIKN
jgi:undecaprenyl-diphosphatase